MTLVMYDTIEPAEFHGLPMDAAAGYVDGHWQTYPTLGQHVPPGTTLVSISVFGAPADCIDVEPGNVTNDQGAVWARVRRDQGHWRPIVYTGASNARAMLHTLADRGVTRPQIRLWTAHYGIGEHFCGPDTCGYVDQPADGTQWTDRAHGRNLDQSVLAANFFQAPAPTSTGVEIVELHRGINAITPVALPPGAKTIGLFSDVAARVTIDWRPNGIGVGDTIVNLDGSVTVTTSIDSKVKGIRLIRDDGGANNVSYVVA